MKLPRHRSPPHLPLHHSLSSVGLSIVNAFKLTKLRSKSDLTTINFGSVNVFDIKYLPPSFDGDVLFVLPPIFMDVPSAYDHSIHVMDKICNNHLLHNKNNKYSKWFWTLFHMFFLCP